MSWRYCFAFLILAALEAAWFFAMWDRVGWYAIVFLYVSASFLLLAIAYAGFGPGVFLKQPSGRQRAIAWVLNGPYLVLSHLAFELYRRISREPAYVEVAPNLFLGRRLRMGECKGHPWSGVLDVAAEFGEIRPLREQKGYKSLPLLDATAPTDEQLREIVAWLSAETQTGQVFVHCALGHGRSTCVVIAYLLHRGEVASVTEGVYRLRSVRPGVRLQSAQRKRLDAFVRELEAGREP